MPGEISENVVDRDAIWHRVDVIGEQCCQRVLQMVIGASRKYFTSGNIEERAQVASSVAFVFEFNFHAIFGGDRDTNTLKSLNSRAFVETEQIVRWLEVELNNVLHFRKEVRV